MDEKQIIQQIQDAIAAKGKITAGNVADSVLGVADANKKQLQDLLNKFLEKKGLITAEDETALQKLLDRQKQERKVRTKIIVRNVAIGFLAVSGIVGVYYVVKHKKGAKNG